jgi:hypothetical protein
LVNFDFQETSWYPGSIVLADAEARYKRATSQAHSGMSEGKIGIGHYSVHLHLHSIRWGRDVQRLGGLVNVEQAPLGAARELILEAAAIL